MDFAWTKDSTGFRAWFIVGDGKGRLRTGGVFGNFAVTVVNPADTAVVAPVVSESAMLPGMYTFLVPSSFLTTNGIGNYGVAVEIIFTGPNLKATDGTVLHVSTQDFEDVGGGGASGDVEYLAAIHIDTKKGSPGTVVGTNGLPGNPSNNIADARTLANALGFREYVVRGPVTLDDDYDDWVFQGIGAESTIHLAAADVTDSKFISCTVDGVIGIGKIVATDCLIDSITNLIGTFVSCRFKGTSTLAVGTTTLTNGASEVPGTTTPVFDAVGAGREINARAYSGGFELRNFIAVSNIATLEFVAGKAILGPTNTGGTVVIRGIADLDNTANGTAIVETARVTPATFVAALKLEDFEGKTFLRRIVDIESNTTNIAGQVLDASAGDHNLPGTIGEAINSGGAGGACFGDGSERVDQDYGGANNLCYTVAGIPIDNAEILVFLESDFLACNRGSSYVKAASRTTVTGAWQQALMLDAARYVIQFHKQEVAGPDAFTVVVSANPAEISVIPLMDTSCGPVPTPPDPEVDPECPAPEIVCDGLDAFGGSGTIQVDQDYGGENALAYTLNGQFISGVEILFFNAASYNAGNKQNSDSVAASRTTSTGAWAQAVMLNPGDYVIQFFKADVTAVDAFPLTVA